MKEALFEELKAAGLELREEADGLTLVGDGLSLKGDFTTMLRRVSVGGLQKEMLVKAARIKGARGPLRLLDATAGMGEDSLILAAAGFEVSLYEFDPVIAALLRDSVERAKAIPELRDAADRMTVYEEDSCEAMKNLESPPDVILLDPMFPARTKSAMIGKKFQLLQRLEKPCADEAALMGAALAAHPKKIVVKRPLKGPYLAGMKPDYSLSGKAIRYDCIVNTENRTLV